MVDATWSCIDDDDLTEMSSDEEEEEDEVVVPAPIPRAPAAPPPPPPAASTSSRTKATRPSTQQATMKSKERNGPKIATPCIRPGRTVTYSAYSLFEWLLNDTIDLDPEYQRGVVWPESKQMGLIHSLFHNFHIPSLLFAVIRSDDGGEIRVCIDGKQRLTSLKRFFLAEIAYKDPSSNRKAWFEKDQTGNSRRTVLTPQMKALFKNKQITCVEYEDLTPEQERETFQRVQLGVALMPADRLAAINGAYADLVRDLRNRINTTEGFEGYLDWGKARGKDFQALAQIVYLVVHGSSPRKAEPTTSRLEVWLSIRGDDVSSVKAVAFNVMDIFCRIAQHPELGEPLTTKLTPLEFVMSGYLVYLQRKKLSDTQLSDAIARMRQDVKRACSDYRFNTQNFKHAMTFVQKEIPKLIPRLKTNPRESRPAFEVPFNRVECESDRFKRLQDVKRDEETNKMAGKRKRVDEGEDSESESDYVTPVKKPAHQKRKVESQTPVLESQEGSAPKASTSRLNTRPPASSSKAKTTIKKSPANPKVQIATSSSSSASKAGTPSTTKTTMTMATKAAGKQRVNSQMATPTLKPSALARSGSDFQSSQATNRNGPMSCAPTPPPSATPPTSATYASTSTRAPLPGRIAWTNTQKSTPMPTPTESGGNGHPAPGCTVMNWSANINANTNIGTGAPSASSSSSSMNVSAGQDRLAPLRQAKALAASTNRPVPSAASASSCGGGPTQGERSKYPKFNKVSSTSTSITEGAGMGTGTPSQSHVDPEVIWKSAFDGLLEVISPSQQQRPQQQLHPKKSAAYASTPTRMVSTQVLVPPGSSTGTSIGSGCVRTGALVTPVSTPSPTFAPHAPSWAVGRGRPPPAPAAMRPAGIRDPRLANRPVASAACVSSSARSAAPPLPPSSHPAASTSYASMSASQASMPSLRYSNPSTGVQTAKDARAAAMGQNRSRPNSRERDSEADGSQSQPDGGAAKKPRPRFPARRDDSFNSRG